MLYAGNLAGTGATVAECQKVQNRTSLVHGQQVRKQLAQDQAGL